MGLVDRITSGLSSLGVAVVGRVFAQERQDREAYLARMEALYRGTQYEARGLAPSWPVLPSGNRTPLRRQKPAVQYDLPQLLVDRPTALLFGEGRAPHATLSPAPTETEGDALDGAVAEVNAWLADVADEASMWFRFLIASRLMLMSGAVVLVWSVCAGQGDEGGVFEVEHLRAAECRATFDPGRRDRMLSLERRFKFSKVVQTNNGGVLVETTREFWHRELWDLDTHTVFADVLVGDGKEPVWTVQDVVTHGFGFVPGVWIRYEDGLAADEYGASFLAGAQDIFESIDRTLGQKDRAVFYNQEPERTYFGLREDDESKVGGPGGSFLPAKGTSGVDAVITEMSGAGQTVAEEHVVAQAKRVLETKRVVSPDPDKLLAAARSGAALEVLNLPMVELVGELRVPLGRGARDLLAQILRAARTGKLAALGALETPPPKVIPAGKVKLLWGKPFPPTPDDLASIATTAASLESAGLCDRETLVRWLARHFAWDDVEEILERLEGEQDAKAKRSADMADAIAGRPAKPDTKAPTEDGEGAADDGVDPPAPKPDAPPKAPPDDAPANDTAPAKPKPAGSGDAAPKIFQYHLDAGVLRVNQLLDTLGMPPLDDGDMLLTDWQRKHKCGPFADAPLPPPGATGG